MNMCNCQCHRNNPCINCSDNHTFLGMGESKEPLDIYNPFDLKDKKINFSEALKYLKEGKILKKDDFYLIKKLEYREFIVMFNITTMEISHWKPYIEELTDNDWEVV